MNYREYIAWSANRDPNALWFGELSIFDVMKSIAPSEHDGEVHGEQVLQKWRETNKWQSHGKISKITTGVRDGLSDVWQELENIVDRIWVPNDVYPVYEDLIPEAHTYPTMTKRWLDVLDKIGNHDAILLPVPLHPIGRNLSKDEKGQLFEWLDHNPETWLLVDAAYDYNAWDFCHERCVVLRTMSKSWLCPRMFGIIEGRADLVNPINTTHPNDKQLKYCFGALRGQDLPDIQRKLFAEAWQRVQKLLNDCQIDFIPPSTGYLAVIESEKLAGKNKIISIPATVFGSDTSHRVLSCLGEVEL